MKFVMFDDHAIPAYSETSSGSHTKVMRLQHNQDTYYTYNDMFADHDQNTSSLLGYILWDTGSSSS